MLLQRLSVQYRRFVNILAANDVRMIRRDIVRAATLLRRVGDDVARQSADWEYARMEVQYDAGLRRGGYRRGNRRPTIG